jgi:hypothetical protein
MTALGVSPKVIKNQMRETIIKGDIKFNSLVEVVTLTKIGTVVGAKIVANGPATVEIKYESGDIEWLPIDKDRVSDFCG